MKKRDKKIDILKGMFVLGMIFIHSIQFFFDYRDPVNTYFNLTSFSGFIFCFGYSCQLAYFDKTFDKVWSKMIINTFKIYFAYVLSSIFFLIIISRIVINKQVMFDVLTLANRAQYAEFLATFALISLVSIILFKVIKYISDKKVLFWIIIVGILLSTLLYSKPAGIISLLIGPSEFPVLQYMPYFLIGGYFAKYKIIINKKLLLVSFFTSLLFIVNHFSSNYSLNSRFPPTIFWILAPMFYIYLYYIFAHRIENLKIAKIFSYIGNNVIIYVLMSNLLIFLIEANNPSRQSNHFESILITIGIVSVISFFIKLVNPIYQEKLDPQLNNKLDN